VAVVGFVLVLVLAAVFELVLSLLGWLLMPWNRGSRRSSRAARATAVTMPNTEPGL